MPTDKDTRAELPRVFEQYTLSLVNNGHECGLTNVDERAFRPCSPGSSGDPGVGGDLGGVSVPLDIGFGFDIDGTAYSKFVVSSEGWVALVDPTLGTFSTSEVLASSSSINSGINQTFSSQAVLLAPWFEVLRNISPLFGLSAPKRLRNTYGLEPHTTLSDATRFGVRYTYDTTPRGRRLTIRWNSILGDSIASNVAFDDILRFEAVLYENGTIEFRYDNQRINTTIAVTNPGATVGVFMPNGTNRFRDFSYGLGHRDIEREQYRYGGAVYSPSYTETKSAITANYTCLLNAAINWPARKNDTGATFVFSPPRAKRRVLPRQALRARDTTTFVPSIERGGGVPSGPYDDRKTLLYGTDVAGIIYPTTLQRFYGHTTQLVDDHTDLFTSGLEATGSTSRSASDEFTRSTSNVATDSEFNEAGSPTTSPDSLFENNSITLEQLGLGMSQPVSAKTKVKLSLAINNSLTMFDASSSIYYYNNATAGWNVPKNSSYIIANDGTAPPAGNSKGDIARFENYATSSFFFEDAKGFNALGGVVSSGSMTPASGSHGTDTSIGVPFDRSKIIDALSGTYAKSVQTNPEYAATQDELISLPITHPFVIEKLIFELPIAAGPGWFNDVTQVFRPIETFESPIIDLAGPALTLSVFNQISPTRRDLIASGTITHTFDNTSNIVFANFPPSASTYHIRQTGLKAFGAKPSAVISPDTNNHFTGTVVVPATAQISNGITLFLTRSMNISGTQKAGVLALFNSPELKLEELALPEYSQATRNVFINGFGRGATGFEPSGRSVFGKEFTSNISTDNVKNPFYVSGAAGGLTLANLGAHVSAGNISLEFSSSINAGSNFVAYTALALDSCLPSPYLVYPGDKLIIAVSKTRPAFYGDATSAPHTSGSILHDIQLITGSFGVTFYGSHLKEGAEYHETHDAPLNTVSIHETNVSGEPVLDQFEVEYTETYVGSTLDDFITGSLVDIVSTGATPVLVTGSRGRVFSITDADNAGYPETTSLSYNLQPWFERAGTPRVAQCTSTERFYDSLMPALDTCFRIDGAKIGIIGNSITSSLGLTGANIGLVVLSANGFTPPLINASWAAAYPFEPRYSSASRLINIKSSFDATSEYNGSIVSISPRPTNGLSVAFPDIKTGLFRLFVDSDATVTNVTSSMSNDDAVKVLYGFGDENTRIGATGNNTFAGSRKHNTTFHAYSPVIRGWKYGVHSGLPTYSKAYFRAGRFGQFRDMLEQRSYTKYYQLTDINNRGEQEGVKTAAVNVTFVSSTDGRLTSPENTWSSNLSFEATSSMPYLDGVSRNRGSIDPTTLNTSIITF